MAEGPALGFAGLLRQLRTEARLTQEELAEAAGLSPRSVSDLERGINRTAHKNAAVLLAGALGLAEPVVTLFVAAARGRAPAAEVLAALCGEVSAAAPEGFRPGGSLVWSGCPYLGLVPFEEQDARVFYGRSELVAKLVQRVAARLDAAGILLVTGESGAGKSSLLRAGLMPRLAAGALGPGSERWPRRVIRPTGNPQATGISLPADTGPGGGVDGVAFSPDGNLLATADADGTVGLWNTATGQAIASLPADSGVGVAFSPNGNLLASADADGTVQTWHMSLFANPYAALCADVGSPTSADWAQYAPGEPQPSVCG